MAITSSSPMSALDRALLAVETFPWSALYRAAIGYALIPLPIALTAEMDDSWVMVLWFLAVLGSLRLVPALIRKAWRFSPELSARWQERRMMAKRWDSYQWRKLFWIGIGLGAFIVSNDRWTVPLTALAVFCFAGGTAGLVIFRLRVKDQCQAPYTAAELSRR